MLFLGYPVMSYIYKSYVTQPAVGSNPGGINGTGQVAMLTSMRNGLIDLETPKSEYTRLSQDGTTELQLVFSDEFNEDGRSFYPEDDPWVEVKKTEESFQRQSDVLWEKGEEKWTLNPLSLVFSLYF